MLEIIQLTLDQHKDIIEQFCCECDRLGFKNNNSLLSLKLTSDVDLISPPVYWAIVDDNNSIISLSGCHEFDHGILRCLFRSATIKRQNLVKSLSKTHMTSLPFSILLPLQIHWGLQQGFKEFVITTSNTDEDQSGKMMRTHRVMQLLCRQKIVDFIKNDIIFHSSQTLWKINLSKYQQSVRAFDSIRSELGLVGFEKEYNTIKNYEF